jgi:hypothetical protein
MRREPGWRGRMKAFHDQAKRRPFDWNDAHCGFLVAGHVAALLGRDLAGDYLRGFDDEAAAAATIADWGFADLGELVSSRLPEWLDADGRPAPSMARAGDVGAFAHPSPLGYGLGVVIGERVLTVGETGMHTIDRRHMVRAWRVGDEA